MPRTNRPYGQYCGVARALDLVGDRWTLLILRDLLPGPLRYRDLSDKQPGLASDMLTDRLRRLELDGLIERADAPRPVGVTLYRLTEAGVAIRPTIEALARFGAHQLPPPATAEQRFDASWGLETLAAHLKRAPTPNGLEVVADGWTLGLVAHDDRPTVRYGPVDQPDVRLTGDAHSVLGVLFGHLDPRTTDRVAIDGRRSDLERWIRAARRCLPGPLVAGA